MISLDENIVAPSVKPVKPPDPLAPNAIVAAWNERRLHIQELRNVADSHERALNAEIRAFRDALFPPDPVQPTQGPPPKAPRAKPREVQAGAREWLAHHPDGGTPEQLAQFATDNELKLNSLKSAIAKIRKAGA